MSLIETSSASQKRCATSQSKKDRVVRGRLELIWTEGNTTTVLLTSAADLLTHGTGGPSSEPVIDAVGVVHMVASQNAYPVIAVIAVEADGTSILPILEMVVHDPVLHTQHSGRERVDAQLGGASRTQQSPDYVHA